MKHLLVLISLLSSQLIFAQIQNPRQESSFIEVDGTAKMEIVPDQIYVSIQLIDDLKNDRPVKVQEGELKEALLELGVDINKLTLSNANADFVRVGFLKKDVLKKATYTLLLKDANQLGKVFAKLDDIEVNRAFISKLDHSNMIELRKELRIKAIKLAKEKADYLLNAIGEKTGKPISVVETSNLGLMYNSRGSNNIYNSQMKFESDSRYTNEQSLNFEKINIQSSIHVKFRIE